MTDPTYATRAECEADIKAPLSAGEWLFLVALVLWAALLVVFFGMMMAGRS